MPLRIVATQPNPALVTLPWHLPLEEWTDEYVVPLPRGISRHVVRIVRLGSDVYAVKETREPIAFREYRMLRDLRRLDLPAVEPVAVVAGREAANGEEIEPSLVTRHLRYSLPYRSLFSHGLRADSLPRLIDALAVLLVRLHLAGFFWGDCSLSNVLFRRDAGALSSYLVDAETGERQPGALSDGQRGHDLLIATENVAGELLDLGAARRLPSDVDALETAAELEARYTGLWDELTRPEVVPRGERSRVEARARQLNELGFDVEEYEVTRTPDGDEVRVVARVIEEGHHSRRLAALTGLRVQENQARRLLNDIGGFRSWLERQGGREVPEAVAAYRWLTEVYEPALARVPESLRRKLDDPELFHEILEHRWFMGEQTGEDVATADAVDDYVAGELLGRTDELRILPLPEDPD